MERAEYNGSAPFRQRMSASRYASSCRRIAARSAGGHESLTHRPRFQASRHLRWSARETNLRICAVRFTIAPETRSRSSLRGSASSLKRRMSAPPSIFAVSSIPLRVTNFLFGRLSLPSESLGAVSCNQPVRELLEPRVIAPTAEAEGAWLWKRIE